MTHEQRYLIALASTVGSYEQSDYLYLYKLPDGRLVGLACEFDVYTPDIAEAASESTCSEVRWFACATIRGWAVASLDDVTAAGLRSFVLGFRTGTAIRAPIEPLAGPETKHR